MKNPCIISFYMNNIDPRTVQLQPAVVTPPTVTVISAEFPPKSLQVDEAIVVQEIIQKAMPSPEQNGKELAQNMAVQIIAKKS